jgi:hypothetical protein
MFRPQAPMKIMLFRSYFILSNARASLLSKLKLSRSFGFDLKVQYNSYYGFDKT